MPKNEGILRLFPTRMGTKTRPRPHYPSMRLHTALEIGTAIREIRRKRRLSQAALGDLIGASRQWVQRLEAGTPGVELGLTLRALTAVGLSVDVRVQQEDVTETLAPPPTSWLARAKNSNTTAAPGLHKAAPIGVASRVLGARKEETRMVTIPGWDDAPTPVDAPSALHVRRGRGLLPRP